MRSNRKGWKSLQNYCAVCFGFLPLIMILATCALLAAGAESSKAAQAGGVNNTLTPAEVKDGWRLLFDGSTLNGWKPTGTAQWMVEDGTISVTIDPANHGDLFTTESFSDFELKVDFWTEKHTSNSGVFLRSTPIAGKMTWYEVNISDASDAFPTGSIVGVQSTLPDFRADSAGKWNTMYIAADGTHLMVKLNDRTTVDAHDSKLSSGPLALQGAGSGLLRFRNIKVRLISGTHTAGN